MNNKLGSGCWRRVALLILVLVAAWVLLFLFPMPSMIFMNCAAAALAWHVVSAIFQRR